ncbi:MAG: BON domain-containing protein [Rickettsiales bacterium]
MRSVVLLVVLGMLSGCTAAMIGGAGAGGYYIGSDERKTGTIFSDAGITSSINAQYARADGVSVLDINVDTYNGVVTLYGNVPSQASADKAVAIAQSTKGVKKVFSRLKVIP